MGEPLKGKSNGRSGPIGKLVSFFKKNDVAPKDEEAAANLEKESRVGRWLREFVCVRILRRKPKDPDAEPEPPKTWKERLTYVADNAKGDKDAPVYLKGHFSAYLAFDTSQDFHYRWLFLINFAVMYNLIFVIGRSMFWEMGNLVPTTWFVLDYVCDAIYWIDTFIRVHQTYLEQGLVVKDSKKLRKNYITGKYWKLDIVSLLPTDLAFLYFGTSCHENVPCPVIFRLNKILRIDRMFEFFDKTETRTSFPNAFRITKIILYVLLLIHWNACFFFAVSFYIGFQTDDWVYQGSTDLASQYIYSFFWSTLTLTTIGETPQPVQDLEYLFVCIDFLLGVIIFATIVGNIGAMISNMSASRDAFQARMDAIKTYMTFRKVPHELESRVIKWFDYLWINTQGKDAATVMALLPDKLKSEISMHVHYETLRKVKIFQDCEKGLIEELILKLKLEVFSPMDYVCKKGDVGKEMYIIKRGKLDVVSPDGTKVFVTLGEGVVFGELSILNVPGSKMGNRRTANVRSKGYSDLFSLNKDDLWDALTEYPEARRMLLEKGKAILLKDNMIDPEKAKRDEASQLTSTQKAVRLDTNMSAISTRMSRQVADIAGFQTSTKERLSAIETKTGVQPPEDAV